MFLVNCDNKGCGKSTKAMIDLDDGEAYCGECDRPIKNITSFAKSQLKGFKQVRKKSQTFSFKCAQCGTDARPIITNNHLACPRCKSPSTNISKPFEILVRQAIESDKEGDKDI